MKKIEAAKSQKVLRVNCSQVIVRLAGDHCCEILAGCTKLTALHQFDTLLK